MFKKEKAFTMAGLTLRIAWLYRDKGVEEEEKRFLTIARNFYIASYSEGDFAGTQMSETRVLYLIAELSWKIGDKDEAIETFHVFIEGQRTSTEPKIIEMAKERWQEIREQNKKADQSSGRFSSLLNTLGMGTSEKLN